MPSGRLPRYTLPYPSQNIAFIWFILRSLQGASILTGLGFTGLDAKGEPQWDGAANVKVVQIEFAPNFKLLLDAWNMKTNIWLRECVYKRVTPKGKKPGFTSSMITFFTSAFWVCVAVFFLVSSKLTWLIGFKQHGISSGYYLTFLMGGFITTAARLARSNIRPLLLPPASNPSASPSLLKRIYDLSSIILSILVLNYTASPFILLTASDSLLTWSRLGWYGHIVVMGGLVFFYAGGTKFFMSLQKAKGILPPGKVAAAAAVSVQNGVSTPVSEKTFTLPPSVDTVIPPRSWSSEKVYDFLCFFSFNVI